MVATDEISRRVGAFIAASHVNPREGRVFSSHTVCRRFQELELVGGFRMEFRSMPGEYQLQRIAGSGGDHMQ